MPLSKIKNNKNQPNKQTSNQAIKYLILVLASIAIIQIFSVILIASSPQAYNQSRSPRLKAITRKLLKKEQKNQTIDTSNQKSFLEIAEDGTAIMTGIVLENNHGCTVDLRCYLRVSLNDKKILVVYNPGEGSSCSNIKAAKEGFKIKEGERVKVYGMYGEMGGLKIISTCSSEFFYIQLLSEVN